MGSGAHFPMARKKKTVDALERALTKAEDEFGKVIVDETLGEIAGVKARAKASAKVWHLRALILGRKNEHEDAAKAAAQAAKAEDIAIKAARSDLISRIEQLERLVRKARTGGRKVRDLAATRKAKKK